MEIEFNVFLGKLVKFYDCQEANKDKDYSGTNPKYYPIGKVIAIYDYESKLGYTDVVCDIQVGERISKAHFLSSVEFIGKEGYGYKPMYGSHLTKQ